MWQLLLAVATLGVAMAIAGCSSSGSADPTAGRPHTWRVGTDRENLPLALPIRNARQVITVSAPRLSSPTAQLQAWVREGKKWAAYGPQVLANLGRGGLNRHERESDDTTPTGSYTLTQAFGRFPNPGTRLPYFQTTPADWWISQPGPEYNTHQNCQLRCSFDTGSPNARLYYVTPQYDLAVAIDFNRFPVIQGAGSGIFLHVSANRPTNGCVSIARDSLVHVMQWLKPSDHPRILIDVGH